MTISLQLTLTNLRPNLKNKTKSTAMKQKLLLVFTISLCATINLFAQNATKITGQINDNNGKAITAATIMLQAAKDSSLVKTAITNSNGLYEIIQVKPGRYFVSSSVVGMQKTSSAKF